MASAGDQIGFTVTLTNVGDGTARNVNVIDTLSNFTGNNWSLDEANSDDGCSVSGGSSLVCLWGDVPAGGTLSAHIVSTTDSWSCHEIENTAGGFASNERLSDTANNISSDSTTVLCPNVTVAKSALNNPASAGDDLVFEIVVRNIGAGLAYGVSVSDVLPADIAWSVDDQRCSISDQTLTCTIGTIEPQESETVLVTGETTVDDCGTVSNTVTVAATNENINQSIVDNSATATATINCPDIAVVKSAPNGTIDVGELAQFDITVTNIGVGTAHGVTVTDQLPVGINWQVVDSDCAITGSTLTCEIGDLAPQGTRTISVTGGTSIANCGIIENSVTVAAANEPEDLLENNTSGTSISANCAEPRYLKTPDNTFVNAGETIGFTMSITNAGEAVMRGATLHDVLPTNAGLSWTIDGGTNAADCSIANGSVDCEFGDIVGGGSVTVHISSPTTGESCGTINNVAEMDG
ncbi:MAG: hypothetical protein ACRDHN_11430, partial [Thermomicrobiales bacterium]